MCKFKPKPLNKSFRLCEYKFDLFDVTNFDFEKQLDLKADKGVYAFTTNYNAESVLNKARNGYINKKNHILIYLGMTSDFSKRFKGHQKEDGLKKHKPLRLGVYYCNEDEDAKTVESKILDKYCFHLNIAENDDAEKLGLPTYVTEDLGESSISQTPLKIYG